MPARSSDYISPPPFGPSARNDQVPERTAASKAHPRQNNGKNQIQKPVKPQGRLGAVRGHVVEKSPSPSATPSLSSLPTHSSILPPVTWKDVSALIFVFLLLPQGISCLLLLGYIMSGTFRGLAARFLARFSVLVEDRQGSIVPSIARASRPRHWSYNRAVAGEFLQLFSINSFILLICHCTMPRLWTHYLLVLAKLIVASRLVGTYTVGTATYVSTLSSGQITTSTSASGSLVLSTSEVPDKARYLKSSLVNSLVGFASVTATDTFFRHWLQHLNVPQLVGDLARFYRGLWHFGLMSESPSSSDYLKAFFTKSPFIVTYNYLSKRKDRYYSLGIRKACGVRLSFFSKIIMCIAARLFNIDEASLQTLPLVLQEISTIIYYAYLVLCIHVISLTFSPFLQRFFIFKDYSKNLDHLSSLTPSIPITGDRRSPVPNPPLNESMMVVNMDLAPTTAPAGLTTIELDSEIANSEPAMRSEGSISARNFEVFCLVSPTNKAIPGCVKAQQNKTVVERKRANSNATPPSTTIVDRYFLTSIQPLWSWVAAIKIFFADSSYFSGQVTTKKSCGANFLDTSTVQRQYMAISKIGDHEVVLQFNDTSMIPGADYEVLVNSVPWPFVTTLISHDKERRQLIKIEGLSPLSQYEICCTHDNKTLASVTISTTESRGHAFLDHSIPTSATETLEGSYASVVNELNEVRWNHRKLRKDENKRITDLKKQVDSMKTKVEKVHSRAPVEGRGSGRLKGLQYSVIQLENEVEELHKQLHSMEESSDTVNGDLKAEEQAMFDQIRSLEAYIEEHELSTGQLKNDIRAVENDRNGILMKHRKLQNKVSARKEEINKLNAEIKSMKKAVLARYQRRQKRVQERFDTILPKVEQAIEELAQEIG